MKTLEIDKKYITIGDLSRRSGVPKHTLRYWENEFKILRPVRKASGQRRYDESDEELVGTIKDLLYNKRYTIEGVKRYLNADKRKRQQELPIKIENVPELKILREIKDDIKQVLELLES